MKYRMYIDEVGNSDIESSENPNHRFLSLTGIILQLDYVREFVYPQMEALKSKYFESHPDDPVIFHRKEMVNAKHPFESLRESEVRELFDEELLRLLSTWQYIVLTVCIDKKAHKDTYTTWRYDPYHYCLELLMERYAFYLQRIDCKGDAIAESRGGKADRRLKDSFHRLWENGTHYTRPDVFKSVFTSSQLKIKSKANNVSGLQLADLVAHPSRNEILKEQKFLDKDIAPFAQKVINILQTKYDKTESCVYGKKFI